MGRGQYSRRMHTPQGVTEGPSVIGVDIGGTNVKLGRYRPGARELEGFRSLPTGAGRPHEAVLGDLAAAIRELALEGGSAPAGLGVGIPATLSRDGRVEVLPNFAPGWRGVAVADWLTEATGLPAVIINDARAFTLAEARAGAAADVDSAFGVTLGTGVGGGLVLGGRLHLGYSGNAGEFGHHVFDPHGPRCGCGSHGCVETYASAPALVASLMRPFVQGMVPALVRLADGRLDAVTPALIARAAEEGDPICREALDRVALVLGVALANVTTLVSVERIVIGGGMAGLGETLLTPLRRTLAAHAPTAGDRLPEVVPASLGAQAGSLGAALHAADALGPT